MFADERVCLTSRVYQTREDSETVAVRAEAGCVDLDLTAWSLASTWDQVGSGATPNVER